jgi:hypothetical protein
MFPTTFDVPYNFCLKRFSLYEELSEIWSAIYKGLHVSTRSNFNETLVFSTNFRKILKYQILMKIRPVGAELFRADRRTDTTKPIVAFRNFANATKKQVVWCLKHIDTQADHRSSF